MQAAPSVRYSPLPSPSGSTQSTLPSSRLHGSPGLSPLEPGAVVVVPAGFVTVVVAGGWVTGTVGASVVVVVDAVVEDVDDAVVDDDDVEDASSLPPPFELHPARKNAANATADTPARTVVTCMRRRYRGRRHGWTLGR